MGTLKTYYPAAGHTLGADEESGSRFWSVIGKSLQFTWFEVPPRSTFPKHAHASEQITYVLSGTLFFEIEKEIYNVSAGDCILIPSYKEHSVWTEDAAAIAVDAWSPINEKYLFN